MDEKWIPKVGDRFSTFEELSQAIAIWSKNCRQIFKKGKTSLLKNHSSYKDQIIPQRDELMYVYVNFMCQFSGEPNCTAKVRKTNTFKRNCPALIRAEFHNNMLEITQTVLNHENHDGSEIYYDYMPASRRLSPGTKQKVADLSLKGANAKLIRNELDLKKHKIVTSKDMANIKAQAKTIEKANDLPSLVKLLEEKYDCEVEITIDEAQVFKGLYFSTPEMRSSMTAWPEMVFIDGTYKLLNRGLTLLVFLVVNGVGRGEIVGSALLAREDKQTLLWAAKQFNHYNSKACEKLRCIMTDKDMTERYALKEVFPNSRLLLCTFHTIKAFNRGISKHKVKKVVAEKCSELFSKLVYSSSEEEYNRFYADLRNEAPALVDDYFDPNWHGIRDEWTHYGMAADCMNNYTNNRLESVNKQIKDVVEKNTTLCNFAKLYFEFIQAHNRETDYKTAMQFVKTPTRILQGSNSELLKKYYSYLSDYAFRLVENELKLYEAVDLRVIDTEEQKCSFNFKQNVIEVTYLQCKCDFYVSNGLPCRHILATRNYFGLSLFEPFLCAQRWTKAYGASTHRANQSKYVQSVHCTPMSPGKITVSSIRNKKRNPTVLDKRKTVIPITDDIVESVSQFSGTQYDNWILMLKKVSDICRDGKMITVEVIDGESVTETKNDVSLMQHNDLSIAGTSCQLTLEENAVNVVMPIKRRIIGKPSGSGQTTTGFFPRKQTSKEFMSKSIEDQQKLFLSWLVPVDAINMVLNGEHKITDTLLSNLRPESLRNSMTSDIIKLENYRHFFDTNGYQLLNELIMEKKLHQLRFCPFCHKVLNCFLECSSCLEMFHKECISLKRNSSKIWFCTECRRISNI